ncbi:MAG: GNAT family N-acetyltransferase [Actinomycetota bacterium]|nr:GNAT family N-acetyltransferase [Acidimicrobiia bacterium]MDQ3294378.1 GNAT family N-acetyltransferase [Actinomycetota bacterium]
MAAPPLRLRPLGPLDEAPFVAAQRSLEATDGFPFGFAHEEGMDWGAYLAGIEAHRRGDDLPDHLVPATFLVADVGGTIVGRSSIRHELNDFLAHEGGHIGYGVLVEHRRRGYATEILRQSLVIARAVGVERALVTCDDDNAGSAAVIERCGGGLQDVVEADDGRTVRRYWID